MGLKDIYTKHLAKLLPQGKAWLSSQGTGSDPSGSKESSSKTSNFHNLFQGMASELTRTHVRFESLLKENDPRITLELLSEWERFAGLPDDCSIISSTLGETIQKRKENLLQKLTGVQGQSVAGFEKLLKRLRVNAKITELCPFVFGVSQAGQDALNGGAENRNYFFIEVIEERLTWLECGVSEIGVTSFVVIDYAEELECLINRFKPAHTQVIVSYRQ